MKTPVILFAAICAIAMGACSTPTTTTRPQKTALEVREMQTRAYETTDTRMVMKSVLNVLQDEGFIVRNADVDLGLITAEKQVETNTASNVNSSGPATTEKIVLTALEIALRVAFSDNNSSSNNSGSSSSSSHNENRWEKYRSIECSANISEYGQQTRVRLNFQVRAVDNRGDVVTVHSIDDPQYYQDFFVKVDKGIFISKEKL